MTGLKGKSGGSRSGAGRPSSTNGSQSSTLAVSAQTRQELRILTLNQRAIRNDPALSQRQLLEELIHAAWIAYDAQIQAAASQDGAAGESVP